MLHAHTSSETFALRCAVKTVAHLSVLAALRAGSRIVCETTLAETRETPLHTDPLHLTPQFLLCLVPQFTQGTTPVLCTSSSRVPFGLFSLFLFLLFLFLFVYLYPQSLTVWCRPPASDTKSPNSQLLPLRAEAGMHFPSGRSFTRNKPSTRM